MERAESFDIQLRYKRQLWTRWDSPFKLAGRPTLHCKQSHLAGSGTKNVDWRVQICKLLLHSRHKLESTVVQLSPRHKHGTIEGCGHGHLAVPYPPPLPTCKPIRCQRTRYSRDLPVSSSFRLASALRGCTERSHRNTSHRYYAVTESSIRKSTHVRYPGAKPNTASSAPTTLGRRPRLPGRPTRASATPKATPDPGAGFGGPRQSTGAVTGRRDPAARDTGLPPTAEPAPACAAFRRDMSPFTRAEAAPGCPPGLEARGGTGVQRTASSV